MRQHSAKKVYVGLSGGVDSSVSATLLKEKGFEVTGVFIKVWRPLDEASGEPLFECTWKDDRLDAMRICAKLEIPFIELDLEKEYKREVVDYMIREYKAGKTPNPDVFCNRFIKFGGFYDWAMKQGANYVATGHYARVEATREIRNSKFEIRKKAETASYQLKRGRDSNKDQSYFLWQIRTEQLPHILFPIGDMKKAEVRALARKHGLITADKKDSQGLCFVGKVDMKEFLSHYISKKPGKIVDEEGRLIGEHAGAFFYTIGERVTVSNHAKGETTSTAWYVISKDARHNRVVVSHKSSSGSLSRGSVEVRIHSCNWLCLPARATTYNAQARYRQTAEPCTLKSFTGAHATLHFKRPQDSLTPGQSIVLYDGDTVVGGGIIE